MCLVCARQTYGEHVCTLILHTCLLYSAIPHQHGYAVVVSTIFAGICMVLLVIGLKLTLSKCRHWKKTGETLPLLSKK